jgi:hypothetical protein
MRSGQRLVVAAAIVASVGFGSKSAWAGFCPTWLCGTNSATVGDGVAFDELNVDGLTDQAGIRIRSVKLPGGAKGRLLVKGHHLMAVPYPIPGTRPGVPLKGAQLVGTIITIAHTDGRAYELKITHSVDGCEENSNEKGYKGDKDDRHEKGDRDDRREKGDRDDRREKGDKDDRREKGVRGESDRADRSHRADDDCLTFAATPTARPAAEVPNYTFLVKKISQRFGVAAAGGVPTDHKPCAEKDDRPIDSDFKDTVCNGEGIEPGIWNAATKVSALVFEGDHYDPETKTVQHGRKGWFNLACAGTAGAKMHLLRHTEAGSIKMGPNKRITSLGERTAMLRMITADYCGNGSTFTVNGHPLLYGDINKWYPLNPSDPRIDTFEAAWGPNGPLCITKPRLYCPPTVQSACSIELDRSFTLPPPCPTNGTFPAGTHVISANPKPKTGAPPACLNQWP